MFRYAAGLTGIVLAVVAAAATAGAAAPEGPRLAYIREGSPLPADELLTVDPLDEHPFMIARGSNSGRLSFQDISWSGDGARLAIGAGFFDRIFTVSAEGGRPKAVPGTLYGGRPIFSPNGETIAFERVSLRPPTLGHPAFVGTSIWVVDSQGGRPRQLTPWRNRQFFTPSSFSPDGATLAAVREKHDAPAEIVSVRLAGGPPSPIVGKGTEPTYSPDGSMLAFVRLKQRGRFMHRFPVYGGDLFVAATDGSNVRQLTFTPRKLDASPSWAPDGQRLAYTQYPAKRTFEALAGVGSAIFEINSDGTCRHRLLFTYGLSYRDPAWQPGPGRGVGRIQC